MNELINNEAFGYNQPLNYNPYANSGGYINYQPNQQFNNIIPFGGYGYNQNFINTPQPTNGYIFQPIGGNTYWQPYGTYEYGQQQNPFSGGDYYSPYGNIYQQQYYNSPQYQQQVINKQNEMIKIKYRIAAGYFGSKLDEDKLDQDLNRQFNPRYNYINITPEEQKKNAEWNEILSFLPYTFGLVQEPETLEQSSGRLIREQIYNYHKELDSHSLFQFLKEDYYKLMREDWIRKNIGRNGGLESRNLAATYDSDEYNALLALHRSSNPYVNQIMDDSRYDNNIYDNSIGIINALEAAKRRSQRIRDALPTYVSSEETQAKRHKFTEAILAQMAGGAQNVTS